MENPALTLLRGEGERPCPVFVGRQPIFTPQRQVAAYELLFRGAASAQTATQTGAQATAQVLLHTCLDIGLETLVHQKRAFLNVTRDLLLGPALTALPPDRFVLEILEDTVVDAPLLAAVRRLRAQGFTIALDDFVYHPTLQPLVELAQIIKLDVQALDRAALETHLARLRAGGAVLLAEKVETYDEFRFCRDRGCTLFQGYFFCRPETVHGQQLPMNRLTLLRLLATLHHPDVELRDLEPLIGSDVALSHRLLRLLNSAFFGLRQPVASLRQALMLLGVRNLRTWVSLMLLAGMDEKPAELLTVALVRAKMCERVAQALAQERPESFFLVGLLSVLDALFDQPLPALLGALPLAEPVTRALLAYEGILGDTLRSVLAYEQGHWADCTTLLPLEGQGLTDAYLDALAWTAELRTALGL
jgi:EAL and modified HD-GYP domain-containing signal transduction protein